jgi:hypothetical protein
MNGFELLNKIHEMLLQIQDLKKPKGVFEKCI